MPCTHMKPYVFSLLQQITSSTNTLHHLVKSAAAIAQYRLSKYSISFVFIYYRKGVANIVKDALIFAIYSAISRCKCWVDIIHLGIVQIKWSQDRYQNGMRFLPFLLPRVIRRNHYMGCKSSGLFRYLNFLLLLFYLLNILPLSLESAWRKVWNVNKLCRSWSIYNVIGAGKMKKMRASVNFP